MGIYKNSRGFVGWRGPQVWEFSASETRIWCRCDATTSFFDEVKRKAIKLTSGRLARPNAARIAYDEEKPYSSRSELRRCQRDGQKTTRLIPSMRKHKCCLLSNGRPGCCDEARPRSTLTTHGTECCTSCMHCGAKIRTRRCIQL